MDPAEFMLFLQYQISDEETAEREEEHDAQMAKHGPVMGVARGGHAQHQLTGMDMARDHQACGDKAQPIQVREVGLVGGHGWLKYGRNTVAAITAKAPTSAVAAVWLPKQAIVPCTSRDPM